ncbi:hypothetical protein NHH15_11945 [Lachnospiraceae bacterium PAL113]|uniref:UvrD-like helicase C-terminal domain-containing protein n=1 Tax=Aequitasia blattaphilus TaxID=2949332 RepID=A0ABT1EBB7_9FIRM|nr:hypothetical protein [Aequitasia blattaphilus]MCR8615769.1 hypothetical protein [Aequitasia blattaphilus]
MILLHNGGWNNYNFDYLLNMEIYETLTPAKKKSYDNILHRTKKLFYVCCTRARENLVVFYPEPTQEVISGAQELFGKENCVNLDD